MKKIIRTLIFGGMVAAAMGATAQNTTSGYFLDNYNYRYHMNPAFGNDRNFVSMPAPRQPQPCRAWQPASVERDIQS